MTTVGISQQNVICQFTKPGPAEFSLFLPVMEDFSKLNWSWYKIRPPPEDLQYFNLNFNEAKDAFFCHINEIEPEFLNDNSESESEDDAVYIDPRNHEVVKDLIRDFQELNSSQGRKKEFPQYPTKSALTRRAHIASLRILEAKQTKVHIKLAELNLFNSTAAKRTKENQQFNEFLKGHFAKNIKEIIEVGRELSSLFLTYAEEVVCFQLQCPDKFYSLRTALPLNYGLEEEAPLTLKSEIIEKSGWSALLSTDSVHFAKLKRSQNELLRNFLSNSSPEEFFNYDQKCNEFLGSHDAIIPEESVIAVLGTFVKESFPWEIPVHIEQRSSFMEDNKILKFSKPLARRSFGLSDIPNLYENLLEILANLSIEAEWIDLSTGNLQNNIKTNKEEEIYAVELEHPYKLLSIAEYMNALNIKNPIEKNSLKTKSNFVLTEWEINRGSKSVTILTKRNIALCSKKEDTTSMANISLKFEYKSSYGAEIMSKSELIKEWVRQALTPGSYTERVRIDAKTFEPILHQKLTKTDIEDEFLRLYNVKTQELLSSLYGLIGTLRNFPEGEYLLRFDLKHKDKIMVYLAATDGAENALSIHELYSAGVQQANEFDFVPIDDTVVTPLHTTHSVLPCCFPHWGTKRVVVYNDRKEILKKIAAMEQSKLAKKEKLENARKKKRKLVKTAKKKAKAKKIANAKKKDLEEFGIDSDEFDKQFNSNIGTEGNEFRLSEYFTEASTSQK